MKPTSISSGLKSSAIWSVVGRVGTLVGAILIPGLLARSLGKEMGDYFLIFSMVMLTTTCALSGLPLSVLREMRIATRSALPDAVSPIVNVALGVLFTMCIAISLVGGVVVFLGGPNFYGGLLQTYFFLCLTWFWCASTNWLLGEIFRGFGDFRWAALYEGQFGGLASTFTLLAFLTPMTLTKSIDLAGAIWLHVIVSATMTVVGIARLRMQQPIRLAFGSSEYRTTAKKLFFSSFPVSIANLTTSSMPYVDVLIAGAWLPKEQVAAFGVASQLARVVSQPLRLMNQSVLPFITDLYTAGDMPAMEKFLRRAAAIATILSAPLLLAMLLLPGFLLSLCYGNQFARDSWILQVMAVGLFSSACVGGTGLTLVMTGHQSAIMRLSLIMTGAYLCIVPLVVSSFGLAGLVWLSTGLVVARSIATLGLVHRMLGIVTLADFRMIGDLRAWFLLKLRHKAKHACEPGTKN